jgi:hypothetical protein
VAVTFADVSAVAERLAEGGATVTQLHVAGAAPEAWSYYGIGAAVFAHADESFVVTSDGTRHQVGEPEGIA